MPKQTRWQCVVVYHQPISEELNLLPQNEKYNSPKEEIRFVTFLAAGWQEPALSFGRG